MGVSVATCDHSASPDPRVAAPTSDKWDKCHSARVKPPSLPPRGEPGRRTGIPGSDGPLPPSPQC